MTGSSSQIPTTSNQAVRSKAINVLPTRVLVTNLPECDQITTQRKYQGVAASMLWGVEILGGGSAILELADIDGLSRVLRSDTNIMGKKPKYAIYNPQPAKQDVECLIEVTGINEKVTEQHLRLHFENAKRSGGGKIQEITIDYGKDSCRIIFSGKQAAWRVAFQCRHRINGVDVRADYQYRLPSGPVQKQCVGGAEHLSTNCLHLHGVKHTVTEKSSSLNDAETDDLPKTGYSYSTDSIANQTNYNNSGEGLSTDSANHQMNNDRQSESDFSADSADNHMNDDNELENGLLFDIAKHQMNSDNKSQSNLATDNAEHHMNNANELDGYFAANNADHQMRSDNESDRNPAANNADHQMRSDNESDRNPAANNADHQMNSDNESESNPAVDNADHRMNSDNESERNPAANNADHKTNTDNESESNPAVGNADHQMNSDNESERNLAANYAAFQINSDNESERNLAADKADHQMNSDNELESNPAIVNADHQMIKYNESERNLAADNAEQPMNNGNESERNLAADSANHQMNSDNESVIIPSSDGSSYQMNAKNESVNKISTDCVDYGMNIGNKPKHSLSSASAGYQMNDDNESENSLSADSTNSKKQVSALGVRLPASVIDSCEYPSIRVDKDKNICHSLGSSPLEGGGLLVADWKNKRLKCLNAPFAVIEYLDLPGRPWAVCSNRTEAAVSLPANHTIVIVSVQRKMRIVREIKVGCECNGIAWHRRELVCGVKEKDGVVALVRYDNGSGDEICRTVLEDENRRVIKNDDPRHIEVCSNMIYVALLKTGLLLLEEETLNTLKIVRDLYWTRDVCVGVEGYVFVCGREHEGPGRLGGPGTVKQYNKDGEFINTIISQEQLKQRRPSSVCYIRERSILVMTLAGSDEIGAFYLK